MSQQGSSNTNYGIGFTGLLTIVFITLKLLGKIVWSWWWVLSPLWISLGVAVAALVVVLLVALVLAWADSRRPSPRSSRRF